MCRVLDKKVKSHIDKEDAPNESHWIANYHADRLATEARDKVLKKEMIARQLCILPGMTVGCFIDRKLVHSNLKKAITHRVHAYQLQMYLKNKYDWVDQTFENIDWKSHSKALESFTVL